MISLLLQYKVLHVTVSLLTTRRTRSGNASEWNVSADSCCARVTLRPRQIRTNRSVESEEVELIADRALQCLRWERAPWRGVAPESVRREGRLKEEFACEMSPTGRRVKSQDLHAELHLPVGKQRKMFIPRAKTSALHSFCCGDLYPSEGMCVIAAAKLHIWLLMWKAARTWRRGAKHIPQIEARRECSHVGDIEYLLMWCFI